VTDVPSGLSLTPPHEIKKKKKEHEFEKGSRTNYSEEYVDLGERN
jgi:hypothetical protein